VAPQSRQLHHGQVGELAVTTERSSSDRAGGCGLHRGQAMRFELPQATAAGGSEPGHHHLADRGEWWCAGVGHQASRLSAAAARGSTAEKLSHQASCGRALEQGSMERCRRPAHQGCGMAGEGWPSSGPAAGASCCEAWTSPPGWGSRVSCQPELRLLGQVRSAVGCGLAWDRAAGWPRTPGKGRANKAAAVLIPVAVWAEKNSSGVSRFPPHQRRAPRRLRERSGGVVEHRPRGLSGPPGWRRLPTAHQRIRRGSGGDSRRRRIKDRPDRCRWRPAKVVELMPNHR